MHKTFIINLFNHNPRMDFLVFNIFLHFSLLNALYLWGKYIFVFLLLLVCLCFVCCFILVFEWCSICVFMCIPRAKLSEALLMLSAIRSADFIWLIDFEIDFFFWLLLWLRRSISFIEWICLSMWNWIKMEESRNRDFIYYYYYCCCRRWWIHLISLLFCGLFFGVSDFSACLLWFDWF